MLLRVAEGLEVLPLLRAKTRIGAGSLVSDLPDLPDTDADLAEPPDVSVDDNDHMDGQHDKHDRLGD